MQDTKATTTRIIISVLIGAGLTAIPLIWQSRITEVTAAPGVLLSTFLGMNDKWRLPAFAPYFGGGTLIWAVVTFLVLIAFGRYTAQRAASPK